MDPKKINISAIIIAKNEQARIETCVKSVAWADEVIVIDNGSTDKTAEIAKRLGAKITGRSDRDFSSLRNAGKEIASGEWLFYIDADEQASSGLAKEIKEAVGLPFVGYEIRRKNYYLGHPWPGDEYILRLVRKDALVEWYGALHESARVKGIIGRVSAPIIHNTHRTLEEMVAKTNEWSHVEAELRYAVHHPPVVWWRLLRVMMTAFFDSFFRQGGWRVGAVGWIESIYQAFSMFITYAKLWELQQNPTNKPIRPINQ